MLGETGDGSTETESSGEVAAVVGEELGGAVDSQLLRSIPSTEEERTWRRSELWSSIHPEKLHATAASTDMARRSGARGGENRKRGAGGEGRV